MCCWDLLWFEVKENFSTEVAAAEAASSPAFWNPVCLTPGTEAPKSLELRNRGSIPTHCNPPEMTREAQLTAFHTSAIQRKTAKSRGSPFLCCLEFPNCLWKWIKFMSSMKQSKSSSCYLAKQALFLFLLQLSSARRAFIRCVLHMHFLSTKNLGENQDITLSSILIIYLKHMK